MDKKFPPSGQHASIQFALSKAGQYVEGESNSMGSSSLKFDSFSLFNSHTLHHQRKIQVLMQTEMHTGLALVKATPEKA